MTELISKAQFINQKREMLSKLDLKELQQTRRDFLENLQRKNWDLQVLEMYLFKDEIVKSKEQIPQYFHEYKFCNTRKKLKTETIAEIDCLPIEESMKLIIEISKILLANNEQFKIFYAKGQRSPHIRIYNLNFLENLNEFQRLRAQKIFWQQVCGELIKYLDKSVWQDEHYLPLEYAIHWKHGTPYVEYNSLEVKK